MPGYFSTLNTALTALQTQKKSLDVTGHNIANANTEGYSRQRAVHSSTSPYHTVGMGTPTSAGQVGSGVEITEISRMRDQFLDSQINEEKQGQGYWEKRYEGLHRIELIFNEPSDSSLGTIMNQFWNSLQDLSNNPEDPAVRETVKQTGMTLSDTFHSLHDQLTDYQAALDDDVDTMVREINSIVGRIADLNTQIVELKGSGKNPNDLLDKRDMLVEDLNKIVNVQSRVDQRGNMTVTLGGVSMVSYDNTNDLEFDGDNIFFNMDSDDPAEYDAGTDILAQIENGQLRGILDVRTHDIDTYLGRLNELASTFAEEFNTVHHAGYDYEGNTGEDFFVGDSTGTINAETIYIANDILNDINKIAAGELVDNPGVAKVNNINENIPDIEGYSYDFNVTHNTGDTYDYTITEYDQDGNPTATPLTGSYTLGDPEIDTGGHFSAQLQFVLEGEGDASISYDPVLGTGNGDNATKLANVIKKDKIFSNENASMLDYYKTTISTIGVEGQRADQMVSNQSVLVDQLNNQRISVSGVSLDEEMSNMIQYQQAYNAASKVVVTIDEMLNSLIGIIG
ncbi:MAG: flagellar hook-associated protein FlgK [Halanaerobiales bacterium]